MKRRFRKIACISALAVFAAVLVFALALDRRGADTDGHSPTRDKYLPVIELDGKKYVMDSDKETVLFIGVDDFGEAESSEVYYNYGQADFLMLAVFDRQTETYSLLHINRDTMAQVNILGLGGKKAGKGLMQLALSHCYGTGMQDSCVNTAEAVSEFLCGTAIDNYFSMNMDAVPMLNDKVGGVTLVVSEDFPDTPELKKGERVTLMGDLALKYVRGRMSVADGSNVNRMGRQREYISVFLENLKAHMEEDSFTETAYELISEYVVTDMDINRLSELASVFSEYSFDGIYTIEGTFGSSGEYVEFYADENKLAELLVNMMYKPYST